MVGGFLSSGIWALFTNKWFQFMIYRVNKRDYMMRRRIWVFIIALAINTRIYAMEEPVPFKGSCEECLGVVALGGCGVIGEGYAHARMHPEVTQDFADNGVLMENEPSAQVEGFFMLFPLFYSLKVLGDRFVSRKPLCGPSWCWDRTKRVGHFMRNIPRRQEMRDKKRK